MAKIFRSTLRLPSDLRNKIRKVAQKESKRLKRDVSMHSLIIDTLNERFMREE